MPPRSATKRNGGRSTSKALGIERDRDIARRHEVETLVCDHCNVGRSRAEGARHLLAKNARWLAFTDADTVAPRLPSAGGREGSISARIAKASVWPSNNLVNDRSQPATAASVRQRSSVRPCPGIGNAVKPPLAKACICCCHPGKRLVGQCPVVQRRRRRKEFTASKAPGSSRRSPAVGCRGDWCNAYPVTAPAPC